MQAETQSHEAKARDLTQRLAETYAKARGDQAPLEKDYQEVTKKLNELLNECSTKIVLCICDQGQIITKEWITECQCRAKDCTVQNRPPPLQEVLRTVEQLAKVLVEASSEHNAKLEYLAKAAEMIRELGRLIKDYLDKADEVIGRLGQLITEVNEGKPDLVTCMVPSWDPGRAKPVRMTPQQCETVTHAAYWNSESR